MEEMESKRWNSEDSAIQVALMAQRKVRQKVKSLWKVLLAQQGIIANEGEKAIRAKSKDGIKTSVNTSIWANKQTREIVMASQLKMKEQGTQQERQRLRKWKLKRQL